MKYSFIIPVYNGETYIDKCLKSLLNQTYKNFEIIIINDGSTDDSQNILNNYAKKYSQIKIYSTKNNGVSSARNYGIENVTGDYFIFVDVDDYVDIKMLDYIESKLNGDKKIDLIKYNYLKVNNDNIEIDNKSDDSEILVGTKFFIKSVNKKIPFDLTCIYAFNRNFWKKNNFKFELNRYHEDFGLIPYVIMKSNKVLEIDKILYYYFQSDNSITRNSDYKKLEKMFCDTLYHFDFLYKTINNDKIINEVDKKIFNSYIANAVLLRYKGLNSKDKKVYKKELKSRNIINLLIDDTFIRKIKKIVYKIML